MDKQGFNHNQSPRCKIVIQPEKFISLVLIIFVLFVSGCNHKSDSEDNGKKLKVGTNALLSGEINLGNIVGNRAGITGVTVIARKYDAGDYNAVITTRDQDRNNVEIYSTVTDSNGEYSLELPAGSYVVEAQGGSTSKSLSRITVTEGETKLLDITLSSTGSIVGKYLNFESEDLISIPGTSYVTVPDEGGNFRLDNVPIGSYQLRLGEDNTSFDLVRIIPLE